MTNRALPPSRKAGRPRIPVLSRELIVDEAIWLVNHRGAAAMTIQALAGRLGVVPSAIYNHASSRMTVLGWIQERLVNEIDVSGLHNVPWRQAIERWSWSYLGVLRANRECVGIVARMPIRDTPDTALMYQQLIECFHTAGFRTAHILSSISVIEQFIFGAAIDSAGPEDIYSPDSTGNISQAYVLHRRHLAQERMRGADHSFARGLRFLLDGIQTGVITPVKDGEQHRF